MYISLCVQNITFNPEKTPQNQNEVSRYCFNKNTTWKNENVLEHTENIVC